MGTPKVCHEKTKLGCGLPCWPSLVCSSWLATGLASGGGKTKPRSFLLIWHHLEGLKRHFFQLLKVVYCAPTFYPRAKGKDAQTGTQESIASHVHVGLTQFKTSAFESNFLLPNHAFLNEFTFRKPSHVLASKNVCLWLASSKSDNWEFRSS